MLNQMNTYLTDTLGPMGPLIAVGGLGFFLVLLTLPSLMRKRADPLDKFRDTVKGKRTDLKKKDREADKEAVKALRNSGGSDKLEKFASFLEPQNEEDMTKSRLKMMQAGYRSKNAVRSFHAAQFMLGIGFLVVGVIYSLLVNTTGQANTQAMIMTSILPGAIGYYLPIFWVNRRLSKRQEEIINGFPDALDMMLVCVEAGQSLDQSIIRVAREIRAGYPALADEFETVAHEIKAGKDRIAVLKDMTERASVPDIASFVTVLIQSSTFGTSIADALRVYSAEMRDKRVMRAEEKANVLPTKLTLGTMLFTLPPLLIILIGPSVYGITQVLSGGSF